MKRIMAIVLCLLLIPCLAFAELTVYFLDVGQGDSAIIVCDGEAMIVDGGKGEQNSSKIYTFLKEHEIKKLEYMVATHPDEDHVGGLAGALNAVQVETILSPVQDWSTQAFQKFKEYARKQNVPIVIPYPDDRYFYYLGGATFRVLSCDTKGATPNEMSICMRIDYGETSFLFTGDIEGYALNQLISLKVPIEATVLKVGHHGSEKSNPDDLLRLVNPQYAIISCGKNQYGHPAEITLKLLKNHDIELYRTDLQGMITCVSDGKTIDIKPEHEAQGDIFSATKE